MAVFRIGDFAITEYINLEAYHRGSGILDFTLDEMQDFKLEGSQEKTDLTGNNGRVIDYKKKNKTLKGSGTSGVISAGLMKVQTGGDIKYGTGIRIKRSEAKAVPAGGAGGSVTTDAVALGVPGAEIGEIKLFNESGLLAAVYKQSTAQSATTFAYDPATKKISLPTSGDIKPGMSILYAYVRAVDGMRINNPSDKFSETRELWINCFCKNLCGNIYYASVYVPRADFDGDFSINLAGDQSVHDFSFNALPDLCNKISGDNDLCQLFVYTDDSLDDTGSGTSGGNSGGIGWGDFAADEEVEDIFS